MTALKIFLATLLFAPAVHAADGALSTTVSNESSTLKLVPTVGLLTSRFQSESAHEDGVDWKNHRSYQAGALVEFGGGRFNFLTGVWYSSYGQNVDIDHVDGQYRTVGTGSARLDYLGIPLLGKMNLAVNPASSFYFSGGVTPAYASYVEFENDTQFTTPTTTRHDSSKSNDRAGIREVNVFGSAAVGYQYKLSRATDLRVEMNYTRSLLSLANEQGSKVYAEALGLSVAMGLGL